MPISLKPHNVETYQKVTDKLKESNKVAVIHPTGTGKMYIALKLLEENKGKKAVYVAPSTTILHDVKKNIFAEGMTKSDFPELKRITYQKLARLTDEEIQELNADIIILDEFHHCGAPEWGKGAQRLLQINEGASVLGLSATPLRYTDGLRDMADELFENNVASEMTLEEAIESKILPEASYVSTLYGYDKELEDMQTNIDNIKEEDKRKKAQDLLNNLREKLDANTQNLPELFSEYMQNKSGKYIVFCRNIEDMQEKMEQAQKMFGGVNSNITIRGVSSKIKESDNVLKEFEQDSEEGTLKLLYAVDMLNEGYHIKDLDGVVMMRPTFSPTIYTQQLGRALTVGGDKIPVILDLVNNFDSCKIIEDFAEKMRQYKGNEGTGRTEQDKKSRLSIFDKTKEFREIAEKITELSKRSRVTLEQKIEIFEKFMQTGEELVGSTTFDGYPIGQWAIQIRTSFNRANDGKDERGKINPTEEQLEKLESMGILERQFDSTIDEKIDSLVEWRKKYPKIKITPIATDEELREYAKTDEEFGKIQEEYEKMQRYYDYVRHRKYHGKLNEEQMARGKEGEVGGVFGYPTKTEELAKKYNVEEKDIDYILTEYGSIDNFYEMHNKNEIKEKKDKELEKIIIKDTIDVDDNPNRGYDRLWRALGMIETGRNFYSSEKMRKLIDERLTEREKLVLERRFGLVDGTIPKDLETTGREIGVLKERIRQIEAKALRKLRGKLKMSNVVIQYTFDYSPKFITDEEREQIEKIKKDIRLQNGDLSENLEKLKETERKIEEKIEEEKTITNEELKRRILAGQQPIEELTKLSYDDLLKIGLDQELANKISLEIEEHKKTDSYLESDELKVENFDFSTRAFNCLKRAGINSLGDLANMTEEQFRKVRNLGKGSFEEIVAKMQEYGISFKEENQVREDKKENKKTERLKIENVEFSIRTFNCLKRAGINSLADLSNITEKQLRSVRNLKRDNADEIIAKLREYGISLKEGDEQEKKDNTKGRTEKTNNDKPKTELEIELEKKFRELFRKDEKKQKEFEKIDDARVQTEKDETETTTEIKIETEETVVENNDQQQEKMNFEDMTPEQLQEMIEQNQRIIERNEKQIKEDTDKSKLIQKLLEQQQTIDAQQEEINRLRKLLGALQQ